MAAEDRSIAKMLSHMTGFNNNTEISPSMFPLEDKFGTLYALGIHLEIHQIRLWDIDYIPDEFNIDNPVGIELKMEIEA